MPMSGEIFRIFLMNSTAYDGQYISPSVGYRKETIRGAGCVAFLFSRRPGEGLRMKLDVLARRVPKNRNQSSLDFII